MDTQLVRWGGIAGIGGGLLMLSAFVVVISLDLPSADDPETLRDFADIEVGRLVEHVVYLGALTLFSLHLVVHSRLLREAHLAAALFGTTVALFGFVILASSSMLHVSTSPLSDLYTAADVSDADRRAIEYAWHGAQSVFDTQLATGLLLVPIGYVLLGVAMRTAPALGSGLAMLTIGLGAIGVVGAAVAIVEPGSAFAAISVLGMLVVHLAVGWRTLRLASE